MPDVVTLGPLAFPLERLLAFGLMWAFLASALWLVRRENRAVRSVPWLSLGLGILAARTSFVMAHWEAYRSDPISVAYFWQGGFEPVAGIIAAAAVLAAGIRSWRKVTGPALVLALASVLWFGYVQLEAQKPRPSFPQNVRLTDIDGRPVSLVSLRGRPFVVNLWASWCAPCRREMPMFVEVASTTPDVAVLLVNQGEDQRLIQRFLEDEGLPASNIFSDRGASLMRLTASAGLPTTLFVRPDGRIGDTHTGELSRAALLTGMEQLTP